ncbi:retrovirus-related pol polyprotein from transposon TNT 1-94 [Tanacetum coccineum]
MHDDLEYVKSLEKEIDELESEKADFSNILIYFSKSKFLGTVHFGNDQFAPILGYGDLFQGNVTIKRVYYVEGLNHNLFSVGQFVMLIWRYTWTLFYDPRMKHQKFSQDFLKRFIAIFKLRYLLSVMTRGTKFLNMTLHAYFKEEGIEHQTSTPRTPKQNGIVERQNRTLVEAARTMLSASKLPLSFWAEAVTTACYT